VTRVAASRGMDRGKAGRKRLYISPGACDHPFLDPCSRPPGRHHAWQLSQPAA